MTQATVQYPDIVGGRESISGNSATLETLEPLPSKAQAVEQALWKLIRQPPSHGQLPGEHALVQRLGVSRGVVRSVLAELEEQDVIRREQGRGTFINPLYISSSRTGPTLKVALCLGLGNQIRVASNSYYCLIAEGIKRQLGEQSELIMLGQDEPEQLNAAIRANDVRGAISLQRFPDERDRVRHLKAHGTPVVAVNADCQVLGVSRVFHDNWLGGYMAAEHLLSVADGPMGVIGLQNMHLTTEERCKGFRSGLSRSAQPLQPQHVKRVGRRHPSEGYTAAQQLLETSPRPRAIFALGEHLAVGAIRAAYDAGLGIPSDLAILGCGDPSETDHCVPRLSILRLDPERMGFEAGRLLLQAMETGHARPPQSEEVCLPVEIIERESTVIPSHRGYTHSLNQ